MDPKMPNFQVPEEMRDFAEKSVEQARKAFDGFLGAAQKAVDSMEGLTARSGATDMTRRTLDYADQNMKAAFDHAQRLVRAKDIQEAMQIQTEFVKSQFAAIQEQMKDIGTGVRQAAEKAAEKAAESVSAAAKRK
jgi:phasin